MRLNLGVGVCSSMVRIEHIRLLLHQFESQSMFIKCPWMAIVLPWAWNVMQKSLVGKGLKHLGKAFFYLIYLCQPLYPLHNYLGYVHLLQSPHEKLCSVRYRRKRKYISPHSHTRSTWKDHCGRERDLFSGWLHVYSTCTVRKINLNWHFLESLFPENPHKNFLYKEVKFFLFLPVHIPPLPSIWPNLLFSSHMLAYQAQDDLVYYTILYAFSILL